MGNCQKDAEEITAANSDNKLRTGPVEQMQITCLTWNKDYQGLFDYESKEISKESIWVNQSGIMMKIGNEFRVVTQLTKSLVTENADKFLFKFIKKPDCFYIEPIAIETNNFVYEKNLWMVVKSTPKHEYSLREGDVVKLGRQKIRVKEKIYKEKPEEADDRNNPNKEIACKKTVYRQLVKSKTNKIITTSNFNKALEGSKLVSPLQKTLQEEAKEDKQNDKTIPPQNQSQAQQQQPVCRICLDPGLLSNPLITPCKCSGSMKYIHLLCLQTWLGKRLNPLTQSHSVTINWKPLLCQLCMSHFLYKIYLDDKKFYTVEIPRPPKPYLVMQIIHKDKDKKKIYSLVSFSQKKRLNLGRKHDTDVRISEDISVSRHHSTVRFEEKDKEFVIEDAASKFGTLVLIRKRLVVRDLSCGLAIQVGPNVFRFQVRRAFGPPGQQLPAEEEEEEEEEVEDDQDEIQDEGDQGEQANAEEQENLRNDQSPGLNPRAPVQQPSSNNNRNTLIIRPRNQQQEQRKEESKQQ